MKLFKLYLMNQSVRLRHLIKIVAIFMLFSSCIQAQTTYYVKSGGNDEDNGLHDTTAWATLSKVNSMIFSPGDSILLHKRDIWREMLIIPSSGAPGEENYDEKNHITFGSYGTGIVRPIILGSEQATDWTVHSGNIWVSDSSFIDPYSGQDTKRSEIFFIQISDGSVTWSNEKKVSINDLSTEYDWTWESDHIYIYSPSDPSTRYASIEIPQREQAIWIDDKEYITIDSLEIHFAKSRGIQTEYPQKNTTGLTIKNCKIGYVGSPYLETGYTIAVCRNDLHILNNESYEGGRRNCSIHIYGTEGLTISNIKIEYNYFHDGYHSTGIGLPLDGGEKNNHYRDIIIRNNYVWDSPTREVIGWGEEGDVTSEMCTVRAPLENGCSISNAKIYNNIFVYPTLRGMWIRGADSIEVYNNTFYDYNHLIPSPFNIHQLEFGGGCTNVKVLNNIFYGTGTYDFNPSTSLLYINNDQDPTELTVNYNLFYQEDTYLAVVINRIADEVFRTTNWDNIKTDLGWQNNGKGLSDPLFKSDGNFHFPKSSPAFQNGTPIPEYTHDFEDGPVSTPPSIGAFQTPWEVGIEMMNYNESKIQIFPNPANDYLNILIDKDLAIKPLNIRIFNVSGKILFEDSLDHGLENVKIPINLNPGIYFIQLLSDNLTIAAQKMIIAK